MSETAKFWIQVAGAAVFAVITLVEATGAKKPTFGFEMGWIIFALAGATMVFEAWRTRRKIGSKPIESNEQAPKGRKLK